MKIDIAFPNNTAGTSHGGGHPPPILSEADGETIIAFRLIDDRNGAILPTLGMDQVTINGQARV
jgi:hypothetical protein